MATYSPYRMGNFYPFGTLSDRRMGNFYQRIGKPMLPHTIIYH